jgi:hypothetical protein
MIIYVAALMRPLTYPKKSKQKSLMQRMYEEKRLQMERGSISGSYFTVTMPDGTVKQKLKLPLNTEPGVHSSLALDQLASQNTMHPVSTLPTITEAKVVGSNGTSSTEQSPPDMKPTDRQRSRNSESDAIGDNLLVDNNNLPRNASQPVFSSQGTGEDVKWQKYFYKNIFFRNSKERKRSNVQCDSQSKIIRVEPVSAFAESNKGVITR